ELRVVLDKDKMAAAGVDFLGIAEKINASNQQLGAGSFNNQDTEFTVETGSFLQSVDDVEHLIVGVKQNNPIYLKQVASIVDGPELAKNYVSFGYGQANKKASEYQSEYPAVTIAVSKRKGAD